MTDHKPKIVVIVGPTSSGKSELAVSLARRFHGEIVSADSRQIYKGMDLGTGKIPGHWKKDNLKLKTENWKFYYKGIPHYCLDYVSPKHQYSAAKFKLDAQTAITDILKRHKLPIICGGTMHWIDAVVYNQTLPEVKPNPALRKKLERLSTEELFARIVTKDPTRAQTIDPHNRRRLIRALEIIITTGRPVPTLRVIPEATNAASAASGLSGIQNSGSRIFQNSFWNSGMTPYNTLWLGIKTNQADLYNKIDKRLKLRLKQGMLKEVQKLKRSGLPYKRLESFGLEYKYLSLYLQKKITREEMLTRLSFAIKHYSKRQLTWWKRNKDIHWIKPPQAAKLVEKFLK